MNRALRIIFSRYGIVVIILVLVLGVIALANRRQETPLDGTNGADGSDATSEAVTADDGFATDDCEDDGCFTDEELPQEAVGQAVVFAETWLNPNGYGAQDWLDSIRPFLTEDTAALMEGVDPETVPATEISGEPAPDGPKVAIPLDTGTLTLTMVEVSGGDWLVSAIDWEQS